MRISILFFALSLSATSHADSLNDYATALQTSDRQVACDTFLRLSRKPLFVLAPMALLRSYQYCNDLNPEPLWDAVDSIQKNWTSPLREKIALDVAVNTANHQRIVTLTPAVLKITSAQSEKENLLDRAIASAQEIGAHGEVQRLRGLLYKVAPRRTPHPSAHQLMKVAKDHRENRNWQKSVSIYQRIFESSAHRLEKLEALNGIRFTYKMKYRFHGGALEDFLSHAKKMREFCAQSLNSPAKDIHENFKLVDAWAQYARDHWSYGSADIARTETLALIAHANVRGFLKARGEYLMSRIHANYNEWRKSKELALAAIQSMNGDSGSTPWQKELWDNAHWNAAWASRKLNDLSGSATVLKSILASTQVSGSKKKFAFWLGKTYNDLGRTSGARPYLEQAIELAPYHYYGLVAHEQLGKKLSPLKSRSVENPDKPRSLSQADFTRILVMKRVGEDIQAQKLVANRLPASRDLTELRLRAFTGDYASIWRIFFTKFGPKGRRNLLSKHAYLIYPKPFIELVRPWAAKYDRISEEYVYSIMRQESAFNPNTHSWANAYGLLQLLPGIARETQAKAGVYFEEDHDLFRPEINIPLGITHMDELFVHNKSNFIMTTASYNGTKEAARRWYDRLFRSDSYEFIEDIPFSETRNYVKLVMRNFVMNTRLKNKNAVEFPPHLIELSDDLFDFTPKAQGLEHLLRPRSLL